MVAGMPVNILLHLLCFSASMYAASSLDPDGKTLLSLLRHWNVVPAPIKSSWNASHSSPCSWARVQCDDETSFVVALDLSNSGISGQLGPEIGNLKHLRSLFLTNNSFFGSIPSELGNCSVLQELDFSINSFTGPVPQSIGNLQKLQSLALYENYLNGTVPESLFWVPNLQTIYLHSNRLTGTIPSNVGNLTAIVSLWLYDNQLSGTIPPSLGNCTSLEELYLNANQLVGSLPESFDKLEHLVYFDVSSNMLEGSIPFVSGRCKEMNTLVLSDNRFNGSIPSALGNCSSLTAFAARDCSLTGPIPSSFSRLKKLELLYLANNHLSGYIPRELGQCNSLVDLRIDTNELDGKIPDELGMLGNLKYLFLYTNNLSGEIPKSIWKIHGLQSLQVYQNSLSGELPVDITELKQLRNVSLYENRFTGVLPQDFGINSSLEEIDFTDNQFMGEIPPNLCLGNQLRILNLGQNNFKGSIPPSVGSCSNLTRLILKQNQLTGAIPDFAENSNLDFMDLSSNNFTGELPLSLVNLINITFIDFSLNGLWGPIPSEIGSLVQLQKLNLSHNNLEGELPPQLANCDKLSLLDVSKNSLNGSIPDSISRLTELATLDLSDNGFSGGIPAFLFELDKLSFLQLGGNFLGGAIPLSIGTAKAAVQSLRRLNLSRNGLISQVPAEFGRLTMLEVLDLSSNHLSGSLRALDNIHSLVFINVSRNLFSGPIPETLLKFLNSSPNSLDQNAGLCVDCSSILDSNLCREAIAKASFLSPCTLQSSNKKRGRLNKAEIAVIALGSVLILAVILSALSFVFLWRRADSKREQNAIAAKEGGSSLLNEIMAATENLNDKYIIGQGAHGMVYKAALLNSNKVYAVKKIVSTGMLKTVNKSMIREIQTIGTVRHRNLVKLEEFWFRKEYGLILYNFMKNGSLHEVLHGHPPRALEWKIRYKIALGTAQGLSYLHFDCEPAIVHRDIKPTNILLDADMEPHISDFGIAKLIDHSSSTGSLSSSVVPGTIGYIAPENAFTTRRSRESDVYSYGVVLLELITRKKPSDPSFTTGEHDIVSWVQSVWNETGGDVKYIVDGSLVDELMDSSVMEQVTDVVQVALRCTDKEWRKRPSMREVEKLLVASSCSSVGSGSCSKTRS